MMHTPTRVHVSRVARLWNVIGPVILSAFSLFVSFHILQPLALALDPTFTLLANRSVGKISFTILVIAHIAWLMTTLPYATCAQWIRTNVAFLGSRRWLTPFFLTFACFFAFHWIVIGASVALGHATVDWQALSLIGPKSLSLLMGFVATFFLALTEEAIFRGTIYPILRQSFSPLASITGTSLIFSLAHSITNPLLLVTDDFALGLGLFLLGFMLNIIFASQNNLYIGMGAHAGLVYVKVFLRRIPLIHLSTNLPWYIHEDLRQSTAVHSIFILVIVSLIIFYRKKLILSDKL